MNRTFNDTGLCLPNHHYMVDITPKINAVRSLIERGQYFTINRPRQYGKTTLLTQLSQTLNQTDDYLALELSFEDMDSETYQHQQQFITTFLQMLCIELEALGYETAVTLLNNQTHTASNMLGLSQLLSRLLTQILAPKQVVLLIDEVDKSSNNQLFLDFLGMLRKKYLRRDKGRDHTFQSIILAGVHDIKTLKTKIKTNNGAQYNSPWNIAIDFNIDLSFSPAEIETMLHDYCQTTQNHFDIPTIANRLHYYTSGYPYLVSKLCKFIDEDIVSSRENKSWTTLDVESAFKMIVHDSYTTTLFDSLAKNLENNPELYDFISQIILQGKKIPFIITNPTINLGHLYGIIVPSPNGYCQIHNRIFEQRIYTHLMLPLILDEYQTIAPLNSPEFYTDSGLDIPLILRRFQAFMREHYSHKDEQFLEREGRLLFLAYLRPIINGKGFDFKEPHVGDERRLDLVITYQSQREVIELKRWYGPQRHQEGLAQLSTYLDMYGLQHGYLLIFDFSQNKSYKEELIKFDNKQIFAIWV
ncbi:MAG TPA: AAA-like domain-containing protein [Anaerolineae bacterium]|nr:AAA-like domain-containing protein [Anaerolineae bacterium]